MLIRRHDDEFSRTASYYNNIPLLHQQQKCIWKSTLRSISEIFIRHNAHIDFGICLLHRHFEVDTNTAIIYVRAEDNTNIGGAEEQGLRDVRPCVFFTSSREEFLPLEYEVLPVPNDYTVPTDVFLSELAAFLWDNELNTVLGLTRIAPSESPWVEFLSSDERRTIATRSFRELNSWDGVITEWAFVPKDNKICIKAMKGCRELEGGGHVKT